MSGVVTVRSQRLILGWLTLLQTNHSMLLESSCITAVVLARRSMQRKENKEGERKGEKWGEGATKWLPCTTGGTLRRRSTALSYQICIWHDACEAMTDELSGELYLDCQHISVYMLNIQSQLSGMHIHGNRQNFYAFQVFLLFRFCWSIAKINLDRRLFRMRQFLTVQSFGSRQSKGASCCWCSDV